MWVWSASQRSVLLLYVGKHFFIYIYASTCFFLPSGAFMGAVVQQYTDALNHQLNYSSGGVMQDVALCSGCGTGESQSISEDLQLPFPLFYTHCAPCSSNQPRTYTRPRPPIMSTRAETACAMPRTRALQFCIHMLIMHASTSTSIIQELVTSSLHLCISLVGQTRASGE